MNNKKDGTHPKGRKTKMLKEMVHNNNPRKSGEALSPVEQALKEFKKENGYEFLEMTNDSKVQLRHKLKQLQKKNYDDNDFLERYQDSQGE